MTNKASKKPFSRLVFALLGVVFVTGLVVFPVMQGHAAKNDLVTVEPAIAKAEPAMMVTMGKAEIIELDGMAADILVADPSLIDVRAIKANHLYVVGLSLGDTNLIVLDQAGDVVKKIDIHVNLDVKVIQDKVDSMFPDEDVRVQSLNNQVMLFGRVSSPKVANRVTNIVGHYIGEVVGGDNIDQTIVNMLDVNGEQQVTLRVRVMEVSRDILKELGPETITVADIGDLLGDDILSDFTRSVAAGDSGGLNETGYGTLELFSSLGAFGPVDLLFDALEDEGLSSILAEPNLTAISGEEAGFLAGGEFPVPSGLDQNGNVIVDFRSFGVSLNFRPVVMSENRIMLQLETEVSSLNRTDSVTIAGLSVPGLDIRRASTTVELGSGGSLMIAGLLQSEAANTLAGLPGINKTPVLGDLLESENFQRNESELVVLVTPYIVKPFAEKDRAEKVVEVHGNPLAKTFAENVRKIFGNRADGVFAQDEKYGYLLH